MDAHDNEHFITLIANTADELARLPGQDKADRAVRLADDIKRQAAELASRAGPPSDQSDEVGRLTDKIATLENDLGTQTDALAARDIEITELKADIETRDIEITELKADIETRDAEILRLQGVEADMQATVTDLEQSMPGIGRGLPDPIKEVEPVVEAVETPSTEPTRPDEAAAADQTVEEF